MGPEGKPTERFIIVLDICIHKNLICFLERYFVSWECSDDPTLNKSREISNYSIQGVMDIILLYVKRVLLSFSYEC